MKNLFDYANKELSQDAFLEWLFLNYETDDLKQIIYEFIYFLCPEIPKTEKIQAIYTWRQSGKIDLTVYIDMTNGNEYCLFIEDKVFSSEHNQLCNYNSVIEKWRNSKWTKDFRIFYKTSFLTDDEKSRVEQAGWTIYDLKIISNFWEKYITSNNIIISMYSTHVNDLLKKYENKDLPKVNDVILWNSYFTNTILQLVKNNIGANTYWIGISIYNYSYFCVRYGYSDYIPYLEIRSRDCVLNNSEDKNKKPYRALILRYYDYKGEKIDLKEDYIDIEQRINEIDAIKYQNDRFFYKQGSFEGNNKQIASTKSLTYETEEEFLILVKKSINRYLEIMKNYKPHYKKLN